MIYSQKMEETATMKSKESHRSILRAFNLFLMIMFMGILSMNLVNAINLPEGLNPSFSTRVNMTDFLLPSPYEVNVSCSNSNLGWRVVDDDPITTSWDRLTCSENPINMTYFFGGNNVTINRLLIQQKSPGLEDSIQNFTLFGRNLSGTYKKIFSGSYDNSTSSNTFDFYNVNTYQEILLNITNVWGVTKRLFTTNLDFIDRNLSYVLGFNLTTFESAPEVFSLNLSYDTSIYTLSSATMNYNGTTFSVDKTQNINNAFFSRQISIALNPTTNAEINDLFWTITLINSTDTYEFNTTVVSQTVTAVGLGECAPSISTPALNFTFYDEATRIRLNQTNINWAINYSIVSEGLTKITNGSLNLTEELILCISSNTTYKINNQVNYFRPGGQYVSRDFYFSDFAINNITQSIKLFLLNASDSTSFIVKLQSEDLLPLSNYIIEIQRYYVGTDSFEIVQGISTDANGEGIGFFKTETIDYRFIVKKDGVIFLTTPKQKIIPLATPFRIILTLPSTPGSPWEPFEDLPELTKTLEFDNNTKIVSASYVDSSSSFQSANLLVFRSNFSGKNNLICNETSTNPTAVLSCDLSSEPDGSYYSTFYVTREERLFVSSITFKLSSISGVAGNLGLILGFFILLILASMFHFHVIAGVWSMTLGVIFLNFIGVINFGGIFITGVLAIAILITMLLKK